MRLRRRALPERDLDAVDLRTRLFGRTLQTPVLASGGLAEVGAAELVEGAWRAEEALGERDGLWVTVDPLAAEGRGAGVLDAIGAAVARVNPRPVVAAVATLDFEDAVALQQAGVGALAVPHDLDAMTDARAAAPGLPLIVTGVEDGEQAAICLALGATAVRTTADPETVTEQLRVATWLAGAPSAQELGREHLR